MYTAYTGYHKILTGHWSVGSRLTMTVYQQHNNATYLLYRDGVRKPPIQPIND